MKKLLLALIALSALTLTFTVGCLHVFGQCAIHTLF